MLKRMEQNGWIERNRSAEDERSVIISLTEHGKSMQEKAKCVPEMMLNQLSVNEDDLQKLNEILLKILK